MDTILLITFGMLILMALALFVNGLTGKKLLNGREGIIFDTGKYLLIFLLVLISIKYLSIIGIVLFSLAGFALYKLGRKK